MHIEVSDHCLLVFRCMQADKVCKAIYLNVNDPLHNEDVGPIKLKSGDWRIRQVWLQNDVVIIVVEPHSRFKRTELCGANARFFAA